MPLVNFCGEEIIVAVAEINKRLACVRGKKVILRCRNSLTRARALRAILKEAASGQAHLSINNRSKFRRSIALHNHCGCVRGYVPQRRACVGFRRVASAGSRVGPPRITATSCRMRSQISPGQSYLVAAAPNPKSLKLSAEAFMANCIADLTPTPTKERKYRKY